MSVCRDQANAEVGFHLLQAAGDSTHNPLNPGPRVLSGDVRDIDEQLPTRRKDRPYFGLTAAVGGILPLS